MPTVKKVRFNQVSVEFNRKDEIVGALAYNEGGNGWMIPLRDMSPNDLRQLATMLEENGIKSDQHLPERY